MLGESALFLRLVDGDGHPPAGRLVVALLLDEVLGEDKALQLGHTAVRGTYGNNTVGSRTKQIYNIIILQ